MRSLLLALTVAALLPASASASAPTVSGTLAGGRGYTVIVLSPSGQSSKSAVAANGKFSAKVPGKGSTLQLVKPNGAYFGPVVLGKAGKKATVQLSAKGGKLGRVSLKRGFATAKASVLSSHLRMQAEKYTNGGHWRNFKNARFRYLGVGIWRVGTRTRLVTDFYG